MVIMLVPLALILSVTSRKITVSEKSTAVAISLNETALIDANSFFTGSISELSLRSFESNSASLINNANVTETVSKLLSDKHWRFGPLLHARNATFFVLFSTSDIEVWRVGQHSISKEWEMSLIGAIDGVESFEKRDLVFWSLSQPVFYFVNFTIRPLHAEIIAGVDFNGVDRISVCVYNSQLVTIRNTQEGSIVTCYILDFNSKVATLYGNEKVLIQTKTIDAMCLIFHYFLVNGGVYISDLLLYNYTPLSASLGNFYRLNIDDNYQKCYAIATDGIALISSEVEMGTAINSFIPRINRLLMKDADFNIGLGVTFQESQLVVSLIDIPRFRVSDSKAMLIFDSKCHSNIDILWLPTVGLGVSGKIMVMCENRHIRIFEIAIETTLFAVRSELNPYKAELCASDAFDMNNSACVNITVSSISEDESAILMKNESAVFTPETWKVNAKVSLTDRNFVHKIVISDYFSGENLKYHIEFDDLPEFVIAKYSDFQPYQELISDITGVNEYDFEVMCAAIYLESVSYVVRHSQQVSIIPNIHSELSIDFPYTNVSCAGFDSNIYLYGEDEFGVGRIYIYYLHSLDIHILIELALRPTRIKASSHYFILLFPNWTDVWNLDTIICARIDLHSGDNAEISQNGKRLLILSDGIIKFFVLEDENYQQKAISSVLYPATQVAMAGNRLILLAEKRLAVVYYVSVSYELTELFSLQFERDCQELVTFAIFAILRCGDMIQQVELMGSKREAKVVAIQDSDASYNKRFIFVFNHEFLSIVCSSMHCKESIWSYSDFFGWSFSIEIAPMKEGISIPNADLTGYLTVSNSRNVSVSAVVNIAVRSNGAAPSIIASAIPTIIDVPWDESYVLDLSHWFSGSNLQFKYESESHRSDIEVVSSLYVERLLALEAQTTFVGASTEFSLVFFFDDRSISIDKYECQEESCTLVSKRETPLSYLNFQRLQNLDLMFSSQTSVYFYFSAIAEMNEIPAVQCAGLLEFNVNSGKFKTLYMKHAAVFKSNFHTIKENEERYHVLIYRNILEYCVIMLADGETKVTLTDVVADSLVEIVTVSSEETAPGQWSVFALTAYHDFFEFNLSNGLMLIINATESVTRNMDNHPPVILGRKLAVISDKSIDIYSIPDFAFLRKISIDLSFAKRAIYWREIMSDEHAYLGFRTSTSEVSIIDLNNVRNNDLSFSLAAQYAQFTSPTEGICYNDKSVFAFKLSNGKIVLKGKENRSDSETYSIRISAYNDLGEASLKSITVRRFSRKAYLWVVLIVAIMCGIAGYIAYRRRKPQEEQSEPQEIELENKSLV